MNMTEMQTDEQLLLGEDDGAVMVSTAIAMMAGDNNC